MYDTGIVTERLELEQIVWTLGRCLDERDFDGLRQLFTTDATVTTRGTASGLDAVVDQARRRHSRDEGIQHIITNLITDLDGDQATGRANLLATFAHTGPADPAPFLLGAVYRFAFRRTPDGWRISRLASTVTWSLDPAASSPGTSQKIIAERPRGRLQYAGLSQGRGGVRWASRRRSGAAVWCRAGRWGRGGRGRAGTGGGDLG